MNVKIIKTGKAETVSASYGMRLIEQGKGILAPEAPKKPAKKETTGGTAQSAGVSRRQSQSDMETKGDSNIKSGDA